jgi:hypothetical protein
MRATLFAVTCLAVAACGDDALEPVVCNPPTSPLPEAGELIHPDQLPITATCVTGGLVDLPGRWFVADLSQAFNFFYPKYEGDCATGFRRSLVAPDDLDDGDGRTRQTWSDGTRLFTRTWQRFVFPGGEAFEFANATVVCMTADGTLAEVSGGWDTDRGLRISPQATGVRFAPLDAPALGLTKVGGLGARADGTRIVGYNVVVDAGIAYVVGTGGLDLIRVTDPANPVHLAHLRGAFNDGFNDVKVVRGAGKVVAFGSPLNNDVTAVVDVTNPTAPVALASIAGYSHSVQTQVVGGKTLLYLADYSNSVPIYDVTDPTRPTLVAAPTVPGPEAGIHDLTADGDLIYANNTTVGMVALDVSAGLDRPAVERGRIATTYSHASWTATIGGKKIVIHGDEGMTPDGGAFMRILDGDPASPTYLQELSRWRTRAAVGIHNMMIVGTKAYVAYYQDGVRIVELADPSRPREVAHFNTWDDATAPGGGFEGALGIRVVDGLIYVADLAQGLIILRETP